MESRQIPPEELQELVFVDSLKAFPVYFIALLLVVFVLGKLFFKNPAACFVAPSNINNDIRALNAKRWNKQFGPHLRQNYQVPDHLLKKTNGDADVWYNVP